MRYLIIEFNDNDFGQALVELGRYLTNYEFNRGKKLSYIIGNIDSDGRLSDTIGLLFRSMLCLHCQRFDLYGRVNYNYISLAERYKRFMEDDYFNIKARIDDKDIDEWNNGESLVIDIEKNTFKVI